MKQTTPHAACPRGALNVCARYAADASSATAARMPTRHASGVPAGAGGVVAMGGHREGSEITEQGTEKRRAWYHRGRSPLAASRANCEAAGGSRTGEVGT